MRKLLTALVSATSLPAFAHADGFHDGHLIDEVLHFLAHHSEGVAIALAGVVAIAIGVFVKVKKKAATEK